MTPPTRPGRDRTRPGSWTDARWREIDRIFTAALEQPVAERESFVRRACSTDDALREQVLRLLTTESDAARQLGESATEFARPILPDVDPRQVDDPALSSGEVVGRYRVLEQIGRGGMGSVYRAERADGQFRQQVALKVVRRGMDTDDVLQRFRYERQILASLQHPNIARLLDGGITDDGRPFLVLELVDGEPIDRYCDRMQLSIEQRLDLFTIVCDAVQHAHQNLIIHRDLKPSNILIGADGTPKLLDFGIAKLLDAPPEESPRTRTGTRVLTPEFAAPEQIRGEPVTTAMDVYALGVVLFELLTGRRPHERANELHTLDLSSLAADPLRPSAAISRTLGEPEARRLAAVRATTIERLRRELRGDLDTITLKALAAAPERRYGSAQQLATDIRRYRAGLPVTAQPDSAWYKTSKFLTRHRLGAGVAAASVMLLAAFAAAMAWQQRQTATQRDRAQRERDKANQVVTFLTDMLTSADPSRARGDTLTVYELLSRSEHSIDTALATQPEVRAEILSVLGGVYDGLGDYERAQTLVARSLGIRRQLFGERHPDVAATAFQLGSTLAQRGQYAAAESSYRRALGAQTSLFGERSREVARTLHALGEVYYYTGEHARAAEYFDRALAVIRGGARDSVLLAAIASDFAEVRRAQTRMAEADSMLREALAIRRRTLGSDHPLTASSISSLAVALRDEGKLAQAETLFHEALAIRERILGPTHPDYAKTVIGLAYAYQYEHRYDEAESWFRRGMAINLARYGPRHPEIGFDLTALGRVLQEKGELAESERAYRQALDVLSASLGPDHIRVTMPLVGLGWVLDARGQPEQALPHLRKAHALRRASFGPEHRLTAEAEAVLGQALAHARKPREAAPYVAHANIVLSKLTPGERARLLPIRVGRAEPRRE